MTRSVAQKVFQQFLSSFPADEPTSVVTWAEEHVRLIGSARSEQFSSLITPWTREPIECANDGTRRMTFVKPIQAGGSSVGEVAIEFWLAHFSGGDIQYNWPNELQATARWKKHMEKKLKACAPVMERTSSRRFDWTDGLVIFPHLNFMMQGVNTERSVTGDSVRAQVNEELHDADNWIPGRLEQAYGRTTAFWNSVIFNISNAGHKGDQLHQAFMSGTQQHWEVKCPGCGLYHEMHARWDSEHPERGGLRYELGERKEGGEPNYRKVAETVRYQMPCGYVVHDDASERRALSLSGRYGPPQNKGATPGHKSFTLESVSVDYIPWVDLIRQKHLALRARKLGDPKPFLDYLRERECAFIGPEDRRSEAVPIVLSSWKKDREGLPSRQWRLAALDYQSGRKDLGESPHWWGIVQDFDEAGNSLIVWEGRIGSEGEALDVLRRHDVRPICTVVDASFTATDRYVYSFCLRNGFNALKVHGQKIGEKTFMHSDGVRRVWSEPEQLWPRAPGQQGPTKDDTNAEPEFWNVSQGGAFDALEQLRNRKDRTYQIPSDVSQDFLAHFAAWRLEEVRVPATNQIEFRWKKPAEKLADHLFCCASYLAVWALMAEIGEQDILPPADNEANPTIPSQA